MDIFQRQHGSLFLSPVPSACSILRPLPQVSGPKTLPQKGVLRSSPLPPLNLIHQFPPPPPFPSVYFLQKMDHRLAFYYVSMRFRVCPFPRIQAPGGQGLCASRSSAGSPALEQGALGPPRCSGNAAIVARAPRPSASFSRATGPLPLGPAQLWGPPASPGARLWGRPPTCRPHGQPRSRRPCRQLRLDPAAPLNSPPQGPPTPLGCSAPGSDRAGASALPPARSAAVRTPAPLRNAEGSFLRDPLTR